MSQFIFLQNEMQQAGSGSLRSLPAWRPAVDVYRCADGWLLKFELAGVRQEDISIGIDDRGITVSGIRRDVRQVGQQEIHMMEIAYSRFERFVALPEPLKDMQLGVELREGMMYVRVARIDR